MGVRRGEIVCVDVRPYRFRGASREHGVEYWLLTRKGFVVYRGIAFGELTPEMIEGDLEFISSQKGGQFCDVRL